MPELDIAVLQVNPFESIFFCKVLWVYFSVFWLFRLVLTHNKKENWKTNFIDVLDHPNYFGVRILTSRVVIVTL